MTATVTCPSCGAQTSGKFCSECGQPLGARACASCNATLSARAKFCPECGTPASPAAARSRAPAPGLAPTPAGGLGDKLPWIIAGLAVLALLTTIIVVATGRNRNAPSAEAVPDAGSTPGVPGRATTDLSSLTPREAADRLYQRIATAATAGDTQQVQFFGPMAIQAYGNVNPRDADARLHIGLIQLHLGNIPGAHAQADSIEQLWRTHLFAPVIRAQAAAAAGDSVAERAAFRTLLRDYDAERRRALQEYEDHAILLTDMRSSAQAALRR